MSIEIIDKKNISLENALLLSKKAMDIGIKKEFFLSVSIVDSSGILVLTLKHDQANYITPESSQKKAYTAAAMGIATGNLSNRWQNQLHNFQLSHINGSVLIYGGGYPIIWGNHLIGGIGIAGAPGGNFDDSVAKEALESYGFIVNL